MGNTEEQEYEHKLSIKEYTHLWVLHARIYPDDHILFVQNCIPAQCIETRTFVQDRADVLGKNELMRFLRIEGRVEGHLFFEVVLALTGPDMLPII